jgi:hypothetical protein
MDQTLDQTHITRAKEDTTPAFHPLIHTCSKKAVNCRLYWAACVASC